MEHLISEETQLKGKYHSFTVHLMALLISLGSFQFGRFGIVTFLLGFALSHYNTILEFMSTLYNIPQDQKFLKSAIITTMMPVGALIGSLSGSFFITKGRRISVILGCMIIIIGYAICMIPYFEAILVGRLFLGFGVGIFAFLCPLYIREIAPTEISGRLLSFVMCQISFGQLIAYLLGFIIPDEEDEDTSQSSNWRFVFIFPIIIAIIQIIIFIFFVKIETPKYYIINDNFSQAQQSAQLLYSSPQRIEQELQQISQENLSLQSQNSFKNQNWKPLIVGFVISTMQQLTGINFVVFYSGIIFNFSTISHTTIQTINSSLGAINFVTGFIPILIVEKVGRKPILTVGSGVLCLFLFFLGLIVTITHTPACRYFVCFFGAAFKITIGPMSWVYLGEILSRKGMSIMSANNFIWTILVSVITPIVCEDAANYGFWFFSGCMLINLVFCIFIPETKGKSSSQIRKMFAKKNYRTNSDNLIELA